jgi:acyl-CoA hydrolase
MSGLTADEHTYRMNSSYMKEAFMEFPVFTSVHLVKGEDLNHHGTLYAGRTAEWFVESGFIAAASMTKPENIVCLQIHGMTFTRPIRKGELPVFTSRVALTGTTKIVSLIEVRVLDKLAVRGFISFIHVDLEGKPIPHGLNFEPKTPEEIAIHQEASALK